MSEAASSPGKMRQFWAFVLVGGLAALVNWLSRIIFSAQGITFEIAVVMAYILGMTTAYTLSRRFVFEKTGRSVSGEIWRFSLVNLGSLLVVFVVSVSLERWILPGVGWTWRSAEVAHGIGVLSPVLTSYLGHRYFTFGQARPVSCEASDRPKSGDV